MRLHSLAVQLSRAKACTRRLRHQLVLLRMPQPQGVEMTDQWRNAWPPPPPSTGAKMKEDPEGKIGSTKMYQPLKELLEQQKADGDRKMQLLARYEGLYSRWKQYREEVIKLRDRATNLDAETEKAYREMVAARNEFQKEIEK
jgi:hypothetical protein